MVEGITVSDLIEKLKKMPKDGQIAIASDEEGNDYYSDVDLVIENNIVTLYPAGTRIELYDLEGYEPDKDDIWV